MITKVRPGTRIKIMDVNRSLLQEEILHKTFTVITPPRDATDRCWFKYNGKRYWVLFTCIQILPDVVLTDIEYLDSLHSKRFQI